MIRKIQITNDLLDVIKSCPSGVIDDIYKIEYYIQGFDTVYEAKFTHEGDCLKVVLPSSELEKLENGILMRRAYYKVSDSSYPDGYYNLTFEDNMNVWLGGESSDPYERQYVTEKDLNKTLEDYALKTEVPSLDGYATQEWVESKGYVTAETLPEGIATESWVQSQGYLTEHQDLSGYALKSEIPDVSGYVQESNLKTINGESIVGSGDITIQTTAENIECGPVSTDLFDFSNVNEGLIQIVDTVDAIINNKEEKKPVFYIDVDFDGPAVLTSYNDYLTIGAQIKQLGADNVVLYIRDRSGYICIPDMIEAVSQNYMTITGMAYTNNYRIYNNSSSLFISFNSFVGYTELNNNINGVKTWVVNQNYAKKTELKTINGQSIVGSGDITIQATGGVTEEWLQNNLKTINGESLIGEGNLAVQSPIEIVIDLDSGQLIEITYDDYKAMIDEYANDGGYTKKLMIFLGSETTGRGYNTYPSDVEYCPDGTIEIGGYFLDDRDENDKKLVYYRIKGNDATQTVDISLTPVSSGGDIPSLDGYATQEWVISQGYITSIPDTFATKSWVSTQGYLTSHQDLTGYATETWVTSQGYITSVPDTFATKTWVSSHQFATQSWVSSQGYLYSKNSSGDKIMNFDTTTPAIFLRNTVSQQLNINPWLISMHGSSYGTLITPGTVGIQMPDVSSYKVAGAICDSDMSSAVLIVRDADDYLKIDCHNIYTYSGGISITYPFSELASKGDLSGYATQSWVSSQGYTTQTYVDDKIGQIDTLLDQMLG